MSKKLQKKHAVMMEYVIVAVLVAAAVVVAVMVFGRTIKSEFNVATISMTDAKTAEDQQTTLKQASKDGTDRATEHSSAMNSYDGVQP